MYATEQINNKKSKLNREKLFSKNDLKNKNITKEIDNLISKSTLFSKILNFFMQI